MQYKTLNEENAILEADGTNASYGNTYKLAQKVEGKTETTGEGHFLDLSPLVEFIKPLQDEWERLKNRVDYVLGKKLSATYTYYPLTLKHAGNL